MHEPLLSSMRVLFVLDVQQNNTFSIRVSAKAKSIKPSINQTCHVIKNSLIMWACCLVSRIFTLSCLHSHISSISSSPICMIADWPVLWFPHFLCQGLHPVISITQGVIYRTVCVSVINERNYEIWTTLVRTGSTTKYSKLKATAFLTVWLFLNKAAFSEDHIMTNDQKHLMWEIRIMRWKKLIFLMKYTFKHSIIL